MDLGLWISETDNRNIWHKCFMNLDAFFEDIEAQGYFASSQSQRNEEALPLSKFVLVAREDTPDLFLSMPLLGKDFIAGFQNRITRSSWILIQDYNHLELQENGTQVQVSKLDFKTVIQAHLIGGSIRIKVSLSTPEYCGYIIKVIGKMIEFVSFEAKPLLIPIASVKYLVVDKLSTEQEI